MPGCALVPVAERPWEGIQPGNADNYKGKATGPETAIRALIHT